MSKSIKELNVFERVSGVMSEMGKVGRDGKVEFGKTNYAYVSEAAFIAAVKPLMVRYRLIMYPSDTTLLPSKDGIVRMSVKFNLVASDYEGSADNRTMVINVIGEGQDSGDKAAPKGHTAALKYALRQAFLVATGDDAEATDKNRNRTDKPSPFTQLKTVMAKYDIILGAKTKRAESDFDKYPNEVISTILENTLFRANVSLTDDYDTLPNAMAITGFIKATRNATLEQVREAAENLIEALK